MIELTSRWVVACLLAGVVAFAALPASAEPPSAQARSAARTLARQGDRLWDRADYAGALDKFNRAFALVGVPPLAVRQAECLEKLGRLVEASETFLAVSRTQLEPDSPAAFRRAVDTAKKRGPELRARLPLITVVIEGEHLEGARLTLDGNEVPAALWGTQWPADPGDHVLELSQGKRIAKQQVTLRERDAERIVLELPPGDDEPPAAATPPPTGEPAPTPASGPRAEPAASPAPTQAAAPVPPPATAPEPAPASAPAPEPDTTEPAGSSQVIWGWVGIGVGVAGVATGAVTGAMLTSQRGELDESCVGTRCPPSKQDDVDRYNQLRPIPTIGFAVGAVGLGAGLYLLLTAPESSATAHGQVEPWVGLGSAGVRGSF